MAVYGLVRHQINIIWTSEASVHIIFFGDGPVHILPYDPQCHELFAIFVLFNIISACLFLLYVYIRVTTIYLDINKWDPVTRFKPQVHIPRQNLD